MKIFFDVLVVWKSSVGDTYKFSAALENLFGEKKLFIVTYLIRQIAAIWNLAFSLIADWVPLDFLGYLDRQMIFLKLLICHFLRIQRHRHVRMCNWIVHSSHWQMIPSFLVIWKNLILIVCFLLIIMARFKHLSCMWWVGGLNFNFLGCNLKRIWFGLDFHYLKFKKIISKIF